MAKARRTIRQEHDDGSATIDLTGPAPETPLESNAPKLPDYGSEEAKKAGEKPVKAHRTLERRIDEDTGPSLEEQIQQLKKAEQSARHRAEEERNARLQTEQARLNEQHRSRWEVERSHLDLVANTLEGQQSALTLAKQQYAAARATGDTVAETEAMDQISKINNKIQTLEAGRDELQQRVQRPQPPPQVQQPQGQPNVENVLAQMPALTNEERNWIREHPETVTDQAQIQRMQVAYVDAEKQGIRRNSPEYFRFFEERLGFESNDQDGEYDDVDNQEEAPKPRPHARGPVTAAPVSRSSPGVAGREAPRSGQVNLTKEEREIAKLSGVDERTYAEGKRRLVELKRKGYYQEVG